MKEDVMNRLEKVLYTAKAHTTGGRAGMSRSSDGRLEVKLSRPSGHGTGTNPEQFFAAGWSACFESAMEFAARNMKITLPADHAVDAEIDPGPEGGAFSLAARLYVSLPGMERATAQRLSEATLSVEAWPDHVPVPAFGPRMVCTRCGIVGADARPNWKEQVTRPSLTGAQWQG
jgi:osmotically inducible protein OsmC